MLIAIISDTHLPRAQRRLPDRCLELMSAADLIVHAGDFAATGIYERLRAHGELEAVHGNVDDESLRRILPGTLVIDCDTVKLGVIHNAGPRIGRLQRMQKRFPDAGAAIFGHSHLPLHERGADGFQIFNPGSPTDRRRAPHHTMGLARVGSGTIDFELIELD